MIEMTGNLFNSTAPAIGHGVNTKGLMGAGIAVQFKTLFPEMHRQYVAVCASGYFKPGQAFIFHTPNTVIFNIASQEFPGKNAQMDYLEDGLRATIKYADDSGYDRVAIPQIGCGIGGLDLTEVKGLIKDVENGYSTQFEMWTYSA